MQAFPPKQEALQRVQGEIERVRPTRESIKGYVAQLQEQGGPTFPAALIGLVRQSIEYHETLELALERERLELAAWAARGLLEMHVWARYLKLSDAHVANLENNYFLDQAEILDGLSGAGSDALGADIESLRTDALQRVQQFGTSRVRTADMVKELRMEKEYFPVNRLLSKLVHPSAFLLVSKGKGAGGIAPFLAYSAWNGLGSFRSVCEICAPLFSANREE
jgi:hypothetical protein